MPDCDYCDAEFDSDDAYLDHMATDHYEELSRIDRRRVDERETESGLSTDQLAIAGVLGAIVLLGLGFVLLNGGLPGSDGGGGDGTPTPTPQEGEVIPEGIESEPLADRGDQTYLQGVETHEYSNRQHVSRGTDIDFRTMPPTGGPHYGDVIRPGFYEDPQVLGALVHNLEHGHVVIYYDPAAMSPAVRASLRRFANQHTGAWQAVLVVPNPRDDPQSDYVLTAWGKLYRMDGYDARVVKAFLSEYLGRGPENPVRRMQ